MYYYIYVPRARCGALTIIYIIYYMNLIYFFSTAFIVGARAYYIYMIIRTVKRCDINNSTIYNII